MKTRLCDFKLLYRVSKGSITIDIFDFGKPGKLNPELIFDRYIVLKETKYTYLITELWYPWLEDGDFYDPSDNVTTFGSNRIYKTATNRFAWETKELAMADFRRKQVFRRERLMQELEECHAIIQKAERYTEGKDKNNVY
jgi:hypothetical protein